MVMRFSNMGKVEEEMEGSEIMESGGVTGLPSALCVTVAVAIKGNRESKSIVKWAMDKFIPEGEVLFKLLHVRSKITKVPTAMGNSMPLSQVREDVANAYKKEIEWQTNEKLLPYKRMFTRKKVQAEILQIESDDVVAAISKEVAKSAIDKLVIGASSRGMFSRSRNLSSKISESTLSFCTVYAVSKGKLSSLRPSDKEKNANIRDNSSESCFSTGDSLSLSSGSQAVQRFQALSTITQNVSQKNTLSIESSDSQFSSLDSGERAEVLSSSTMSSYAGCLTELRFKSLVTENQSSVSEQASTSDGPDFSSQSPDDIDLDIEKMRIELKQVQRMCAMAQSEATDTSNKLNDLYNRRLEEASKLKEVHDMEIKAKESAMEETKRCEAAKREAKYLRNCAEREVTQRKEAEMRASVEAKEKEILGNALVGPTQMYQKFEWEAIVSATSSFSDTLRIGMGAYGTVYKCSFHHTTAAVKVLHSEEVHGTKQFRQELEILSKIRHPHLLILLGACPEHGCLVYEYMENGSLEDRLLQKDDTPPIPWFDRFRIAWEIASALAFLHNSNSQPIIHCDLKPGNILLGKDYVSKIGDVGLSKMLHSDAFSISTMLDDTALVGTRCYIDPEYQRTGLISVKSDVYAFGVVVLQLLTGKPAMALPCMVEEAMNDGRLGDVLDLGAGCWPIKETKALAELGLKCAELRRSDRPDLREEVLPLLDRLKELADVAKDVAVIAKPSPPSHFICPILREIMEDPCVASDGYTYDCEAIQTWLQESDKSPMTGLPLPNKSLIPDCSLRSAIARWRLGK